MMTSEDKAYLRRCRDLATLPGALTEPNPRVGAVVVHANRIIGEGWHALYGTGHAEVNAIAAVKNPALLASSTLYVSLEPCNHQGLTPPCTDLILRHRIPRVVIGSLDPNPQMSGKSVTLLRAQGVEVLVNPSPSSFHRLNAHFRWHIQQNRPFVTLKWAESQDGFIARHDENAQAQTTRISDPHISRWVHFQRSQHQAILVGQQTVRIDNPSLTTRLAVGPNPVPILFDPDLALFREANRWKVFTAPRVIVLNHQETGQHGNCELVQVAGLPLSDVLKELYQGCKIGSVLVEGGAATLRPFLSEGLWEEIWRNIGAVRLGSGVQAPALAAVATAATEYTWGSDRLLHYSSASNFSSHKKNSPKD